jgi:recombinase
MAKAFQASSSVRHILRNERYRGVVLYGKTKKIRNPKTGKRTYRRKPESEWIRVEDPAMRIVSDELWNSVRERSAFMLQSYGDAEKKLACCDHDLPTRLIFSAGS